MTTTSSDQHSSVQGAMLAVSDALSPLQDAIAAVGCIAVGIQSPDAPDPSAGLVWVHDRMLSDFHALSAAIAHAAECAAQAVRHG